MPLASLIALILLIAHGSVSVAGDHPWRPPFGLDRVGKSTVHPDFEADVTARPSTTINPVDLGAIFVPHGWLLLAPQQKASATIATISHSHGLEDAAVRAWFASSPERKSEARITLTKGVVTLRTLELTAPDTEALRDTLHIAVTDATGTELWHKSISVMLVRQPPQLPRFGAVELKLRYDLPITVNSGEGGKLGKLSFIDYDKGWDPELKDVLVCLPNGSRFVFWRGSSYIPFWAGEHNTGLCYEWAETTPPPGGFVDSVEPLMDKELRYGRVEIIESTATRVHVRWTYQSTDFQSRVWGDEAVEDFFFYPDGFGTRVLTLKRRPRSEYELSEFIILTSPGTYPLEVVPTDAVEMLYLDGGKSTLSFPPEPSGSYNAARHRRLSPVVYRIRSHRDDLSTAIYFHPSATHYPQFQFGPFQDGGQVVTPAYWGSHWPLSRGKSTGAAIDDRIGLSPAHNSLLTWGLTNRPPSLCRAEVRTLDTLGRSKDMLIERWAWLIAMTDSSDARLLDWARSFSTPPSIDVQGAQPDIEAYAIDRRALRLNVTNNSVVIALHPESAVVNPVLELGRAAGSLSLVELDGHAVPAGQYAWDGATLWIDATIGKPAILRLQFR